MSASLEQNCESLIVATLKTNPDLWPNFSIVRADEDTQANKNRITVSAQPREVELPGQEPGQVKAWRVLCSVQINYIVNQPESVYDANIAAIEATLGPVQPPAAVIAFAQTSFPYGCRLEQTSEGTGETSQNTRTRARTFRFILPTS